MKYHSTRGSQTYDFETCLFKGLASDGGLFIPVNLPSIDLIELKNINANQGFIGLAQELLSKFISEDEIPRKDLNELVELSYSQFTSKDVTPLDRRYESDNVFVLELFHGPTYAFKDVALQLVGNLFNYFLSRKPDAKKLTVIGATSGDTGSAAIYGLKGKDNVEVIIFHPKGKVSKVQEAQMTSVLDNNVHNVALEGSFDDCQDLVKALFQDAEFNLKFNLGAVNSINVARILAQITYYFKAYLDLAPQNKIDFVVPTGNFGDILAGYFAKQMGLPINDLVIACNRNATLHNTLVTGTYIKGQVESSLAPAMDISVSSNFERLLWYAIQRNDPKLSVTEVSKTLNGWMHTFSSEGKLTLPEGVLNILRNDFKSAKVTDSDIESVIHSWFNRSPSYLLDPHTATAAHYLEKRQPSNLPAVILATAHPAKFPEAIQKSINSNQSSSIPFDFDSLVGEGYLPQPFKHWNDLSLKKRCHHFESKELQQVKLKLTQLLEERV